MLKVRFIFQFKDSRKVETQWEPFTGRVVLPMDSVPVRVREELDSITVEVEDALDEKPRFRRRPGTIHPILGIP